MGWRCQYLLLAFVHEGTPIVLLIGVATQARIVGTQARMLTQIGSIPCGCFDGVYLRRTLRAQVWRVCDNNTRRTRGLVHRCGHVRWFGCCWWRSLKACIVIKPFSNANPQVVRQPISLDPWGGIWPYGRPLAHTKSPMGVFSLECVPVYYRISI